MKKNLKSAKSSQGISCSNIDREFVWYNRKSLNNLVLISLIKISDDSIYLVFYFSMIMMMIQSLISLWTLFKSMRWWKSDNKRLCAMKHCTVPSWIPLPAGLSTPEFGLQGPKMGPRDPKSGVLTIWSPRSFLYFSMIKWKLLKNIAFFFLHQTDKIFHQSWGTSNEYPQCTFSWRNMRTIYTVESGGPVMWPGPILFASFHWRSLTYILWRRGIHARNVNANNTIAPDKRGYAHIFLISPQKCMLWVLIRSASTRAQLFKTNDVVS